MADASSTHMSSSSSAGADTTSSGAAGATEQRRMVKLRQVLATALSKSSRHMDRDEVFACWQDAKLDRDAFDQLMTQALEQLDNNIQSEVAELCKEHALEGKFAALDALIESQPVSSHTGRRRAAPTDVNPLDVVREARVGVKQNEKQRLEGIIAELEKENSTMRAEVKMKTVRLQDAKQKLAARQQELEQATACLGTLGM